MKRFGCVLVFCLLICICLFPTISAIGQQFKPMSEKDPLKHEQMDLENAIKPFLGTWEGLYMAHGEVGQKKPDLARRLKVFMSEGDVWVFYEREEFAGRGYNPGDKYSVIVEMKEGVVSTITFTTKIGDQLEFKLQKDGKLHGYNTSPSSSMNRSAGITSPGIYRSLVLERRKGLRD